jgi:hypothetical protein
MNGFISQSQRALALKRLWLAHTYSFNWAHKPLCDRFRRDVVRIGHVYLCRSCLLAYAGIFAGTAACFWNPPWLRMHSVLVLAMLASTTVFLSSPLWYKRWPRSMRDVLRFSMGLTVALCGYVLFTGHIITGIVGIVVLAAFWRTYMAQRQKRRLESCGGCTELGNSTVCSGYLQQTQHLRLYEEKATEWVMTNGVPFSTETTAKHER